MNAAHPVKNMEYSIFFTVVILKAKKTGKKRKTILN